MQSSVVSGIIALYANPIERCRAMSCPKTTIISLSNETTASQDYYEVSQPVLDVLSRMSEMAISRYMPPQSPYGLGYETVTYAEGLVRLAKANGVADRDITVRVASVPSFCFDTGWAADSFHEADATDDGDADGDDEVEAPVSDGTTDKEPPVTFDPSVTLTQEQIRELRRQTDFVDGQIESIGTTNRFVTIATDGSRFIAFAPTPDTAGKPEAEKVWEQPYEVRKVPRQLVINSGRWVPVDGDGRGVPDGLDDLDDATLDAEIDRSVEVLWEAERATEI